MILKEKMKKKIPKKITSLGTDFLWKIWRQDSCAIDRKRDWRKKLQTRLRNGCMTAGRLVGWVGGWGEFGKKVQPSQKCTAQTKYIFFCCCSTLEATDIERSNLIAKLPKSNWSEIWHIMSNPRKAFVCIKSLESITVLANQPKYRFDFFLKVTSTW